MKFLLKKTNISDLFRSFQYKLHFQVFLIKLISLVGVRNIK